MDWWHKMRRVWISVSARIKHSRKHGETNGGRDAVHSASGLLNLRDDVQMCGYKDVQVMWNMLSKSPKEEQKVAVASRPAKPKCSQQRLIGGCCFGHTPEMVLLRRRPPLNN